MKIKKILCALEFAIKKDFSKKRSLDIHDSTLESDDNDREDANKQ